MADGNHYRPRNPAIAQTRPATLGPAPVCLERPDLPALWVDETLGAWACPKCGRRGELRGSVRVEFVNGRSAP